MCTFYQQGLIRKNTQLRWPQTNDSANHSPRTDLQNNVNAYMVYYIWREMDYFLCTVSVLDRCVAVIQQLWAGFYIRGAHNVLLILINRLTYNACRCVVGHRSQSLRLHSHFIPLYPSVRSMSHNKRAELWGKTQYFPRGSGAGDTLLVQKDRENIALCHICLLARFDRKLGNSQFNITVYVNLHFWSKIIWYAVFSLVS